MRYNQFSYIPCSQKEALKDLEELGFSLRDDMSNKGLLQQFVEQIFFNYPNPHQAIRQLIADDSTDLATFFQSDQALSADVFYLVALQLLEFVPHFDFTDTHTFLKDIQFPISYQADAFILNLHQLLATRTKNGNTLIDTLMSKGLLTADNHYHFFNGKSLPTFDTKNLIREVVYVETPVDSAKTGELDLVKVSIIRPQTTEKLPVMMTQSPYHEGINEKASDDRLHKMEAELATKPAGKITITDTSLSLSKSEPTNVPETTELETFGSIRTYTLNDYMLARGFASLYVSGIGTLGSTGMMTSGDYQQIEGFKAVVDWLNGRANAYQDRTRQKQVKAHWATGDVVTTGISYLGTLSTGLATTGVKGLKVIIAEAGISSWYDYYRENGLVCSPGGYPGEDLDVLTELTYSRQLQAGSYLRHHNQYQKSLDTQTKALDRASGDYNSFWHARNYLPKADNIQCDVIYTHGLQDWNVKPSHVYHIFNALPSGISKHLFLHQGAHVYMNNWQSIDFRESINAFLSDRVLGFSSHYQLPPVIWQDNRQPQTWHQLTQFGENHTGELKLGHDENIIKNHYANEDFAAFSKDFNAFKQALFKGKIRNAITCDLKLSAPIQINGRMTLKLKVKSSTSKGLLSAQVLQVNMTKGFGDTPRPIRAMSMDNGVQFMQENLCELPYQATEHRVISKVFMNLQNREDLLTISEITPDEWMTVSLDLQPSIYHLEKGDTLRIILYTTDFEHTIRDNTDYQLTLDLFESSLVIPHNPA